MLQPRINYRLDPSDYLALITSIFKSESENSYFSNLFKKQDILFFDKARNGLRFILENINIPEARIGIQPLTCPTVLEAIYLANCKPVFIDISEDYAISADALQKKIAEIDVLIVTHTFGIYADTLKLKKILKEKILIEDCAHGFLTESAAGEIAGINGDFSLFSYGFGKFPVAISGGFVCIKKNKSDKYIQEYNNSIKSTTLKKQFLNIILSIILPVLNNKLIYTFITSKIKKSKNKSYTLPSKSALKISYFKSNKSIFLHQLQKISINLQKQKSNGELLLKAIDKNSFISTYQKSTDSNFFMLPLQIKNADYFIQECLKNGIEVGKHFVKTREIIDYYGYTKGECPNYEQIIENLVTLPTHYNYPANKTKLLAEILTNYKPV